ncbi:MAG: GDP-mannose 4,6-dehydratase [Candidatus Levyibacteriota bacterium]
MKIFITGITGFAGSHLAQYLLSQKTHTVSGTYLTESSLATVSEFRDDLQLISLNLLDGNAVSETIEKEKPDVIFHLAALTSPSDSFTNPSETMTNNITAQVNLLEAVKHVDLQKTKILIVSSAEVYGLVEKENLPIDEETPFRPTNPYAVSKLAQDFLGLQYFLSHKLSIIRVRPFNHIGPRQSPSFVVSAFAKKIAEIEKKIKEPVLTVGNLEAKRDFTDVRDMVQAYDVLMQKGTIGDVYNIGSGKSYKIKDILDMLLSFSSVKISVQEDPVLLRPLDNPELVSDNSKIQAATGWQPTIAIEKTLQDTLEYWRNIL